MSGRIDARLKELGLMLPAAPAPAANYVPFVRTGALVFISGQLPMRDGKPQFVGRVGQEVSVEDGAQVRGEALNATNTPHFSNPGANVSNLQLNPDGTVRSLGGFSQITVANPLGRIIDQRYFRFGLRINF